IVECDSGNGQATFDLSIAGDEAVDGQVGITPTYYNAAGQITSPFTGGSQTISIHLTDDITGCFTVVDFEIEVVPAPPIADPIPAFMLCDNDGDGEEEFILTDHDLLILGGIPPGTVDITYYDDPLYTNLITPAVITSTGGQTIYVRVTYNDGSGCYTDGEFLIDLYPAIQYTVPGDYELCENALGSGEALFDLDQWATNITTDPNYSMTYYLSQADAEAGTTGQITSP